MLPSVPATLRDMAAALYISPNYLSDLFKKNTGMRLSDYITEVRLEKAREYLMDVHYKEPSIHHFTQRHQGYRSLVREPPVRQPHLTCPRTYYH